MMGDQTVIEWRSPACEAPDHPRNVHPECDGSFEFMGTDPPLGMKCLCLCHGRGALCNCCAMVREGALERCGYHPDGETPLQAVNVVAGGTMSARLRVTTNAPPTLPKAKDLRS